MATKEVQITSPGKRLWLRFLILIPLIAVMAISCYAHIRSVCSTYAAWTPVTLSGEDFSQFDEGDVRYSMPGVVEAIAVEGGAEGAACVTFRAIADGKTDVTFGNDQLSAFWNMEVRDGAIICDGVEFSGWESIHICLCILFAVITALCASILIRLQRIRWFGYGMVVSSGTMLFFLFQFVLFTVLLVRGSLRNFSDLAIEITFAADYFALASAIPMALLALLVSISNIALIRHEGMRPVNLLGIIASLLWIAAMCFWIQWWRIADDLGLPFETLQIVASMLSVAIAYGVCLLLATILCAWIASRVEPNRPLDYLVILGCGILSDGTPTPLLAGRVDRARKFDADRVAAGDPPVVFVPSGGQGPDEVVSEAQSMSDYLVGKGVSAERIVLEDRSATTRENMVYSRRVIEEHAGCDASTLSVGFSTTNYHVFRGYVCAHQAGMAVQGMGSKTRAYFWPNAFLREFAGLLAARWKGILIAYAIIASIYAFAGYVFILM